MAPSPRGPNAAGLGTAGDGPRWVLTCRRGREPLACGQPGSRDKSISATPGNSRPAVETIDCSLCTDPATQGTTSNATRCQQGLGSLVPEPHQTPSERGGCVEAGDSSPGSPAPAGPGDVHLPRLPGAREPRPCARGCLVARGVGSGRPAPSRTAAVPGGASRGWEPFALSREAVTEGRTGG